GPATSSSSGTGGSTTASSSTSSSGGGQGGSGGSPPVNYPIKHVVVIVKENHTFDNYFGSFPGADGIAEIQTPSGMITPPHAPDRTKRDLCHTHACALTDYAGNWLD